ncbi:MAG: secretin N-terminal domain-containing protein [Desulfobacterales bacterium]|jgi:hypothetical protein
MIDPLERIQFPEPHYLPRVPKPFKAQLLNGMRRRVAACCSWVLIALGVAMAFGVAGIPARASEEVAQLRIVHREVTDILTMVKPLVSKYGFISADIPSNSLIVIDQAANVARIRKLVSSIDQPVPELKILVQYDYQRSARKQSATASGRIETGDVTIDVGKRKKEGLAVELSDDRENRRNSSDYAIIVRSGSTAYLRSGVDVPYPERWVDLSHEHGYTGRSVTFRRVDTGYDVRPVLVGNNVLIDITPRISYLNQRGKRQPIRFAEAATRLNVPLGEWVEIAGTDTRQNEIHRQILGAGRSSAEAGGTMRLMVTRN